MGKKANLSSLLLPHLLQNLGTPNLFAPLGSVFKPFDPPQPPLIRGENLIKVPLFKGDLGGSSSNPLGP